MRFEGRARDGKGVPLQAPVRAALSYSAIAELGPRKSWADSTADTIGNSARGVNRSSRGLPVRFLVAGWAPGSAGGADAGLTVSIGSVALCPLPLGFCTLRVDRAALRGGRALWYSTRRNEVADIDDGPRDAAVAS